MARRTTHDTETPSRFATAAREAEVGLSRLTVSLAGCVGPRGPTMGTSIVQHNTVYNTPSLSDYRPAL